MAFGVMSCGFVCLLCLPCSGACTRHHTLIEQLAHCKHLHHRTLIIPTSSLQDINLRELTKKYGRGIGLNIAAVSKYSAQMLISLYHLRNCGVLHADIKPDNILVSASRTMVKLADFGSAMFSGDNEITPYLVSRFYRAPEVILGLKYGKASCQSSVAKAQLVYLCDVWQSEISVPAQFLLFMCVPIQQLWCRVNLQLARCCAVLCCSCCMHLHVSAWMMVYTSQCSQHSSQAGTTQHVSTKSKPHGHSSLFCAADHALDIWSVGSVIYELFTGKILFPGKTNNEMLKLIMDVKGPFPKKMLKKGAFTDRCVQLHLGGTCCMSCCTHVGPCREQSQA